MPYTLPPRTAHRPSGYPRQLLLGLLLPLLTAVAVGAAEPAPTPEARHVTGTFLSGGSGITVERFSPREGRHPSVVLLHGIDGLWKNGKVYRGIAERLAEQGFVVFLPHYFEATSTREADVPRLLTAFQAYLRAGRADGPEWHAVRQDFQRWTGVARDAAAHARRQPGVDADRLALAGISLGGYLALSAAGTVDGAAAVVDCFGGLPRELRAGLKGLPPVLVLHGDADGTVPVGEAYAVRDLLTEKRLPIEFKVYRGVGHVFLDARGRMSLVGAMAAADAEARVVAFLQRHLKTDGPVLTTGNPPGLADGRPGGR